MANFRLLLTTILSVTITLSKSSEPSKSSSKSHCDDATWIKFSDTKCYKIVPKFLSWEAALNACQQFSGQTPSRLVKINSVHEQTFLTQYLFNTSNIVNNVWIGAARESNENGDTFLWTDGTATHFTNWAVDSPTEEVGRDCVEMTSGWDKNDPNDDDGEWEPGFWRDIGCEVGNWAVCEKFQIWDAYETQQSILALRWDAYETQQAILALRWDAYETQQAILALRDNPPVPIGFLYTELGGQLAPQAMWPMYEWMDVSDQYGGLFFRVHGGNSGDFGVTQSDSTRQVTTVKFNKLDRNPNYPWSVSLPPTGWSNWVCAGYDDAGDNGGYYYHGMQFEHSAVEVRPQNMAVRIWKRTV